MMIYTFRCGGCGQTREEWQSISDAHSCPPCACGGTMNRVFNATIIGDEIKSCTYIHPRTGKEKKDHGHMFDMGLGGWYDTKSQRKALMKKKGLHEYGPNREV